MSSPQETRLGVPLSHKSFTPSETHKDNPFFVLRCFTTRDSGSLSPLLEIKVVVLALVVVEFHVLVVVKELLSLVVMDFEYDMERVLIGGIGDESLTLHMDEDQWMYDSIMSEEVEMNVENEEDAGIKVDCFDAFNTFEPVSGGDDWMVKLICGIHNHEMENSLVGHSYAGRMTKDEKIVVVDMTKSMVKPRNILLTLKKHNDNNYTTIKQIYNARHAYRSSIRGSNTETQQLMMLLDRDQYIHWHRLKDDNVIRDLFWSHPDAVKLTNSCNLVFLIDSTYKTNRYKLSLLDIVGVTPTGMTFFAGFAYLEGERLNNVFWALERFQGLFMRVDALPEIITIRNYTFNIDYFGHSTSALKPMLKVTMLNVSS
ncbi:hypothetical protein D0Y65_009619, partial [Glycine soja]